MKIEESSPSSGMSVKQYAVQVFHDSLVTGVPNIVQAPKWKWKIFKICVLALCIAGFLYQSVEFVSFVLTYPSVVDIHVYNPKEFLYPAVTMCNNNGIKRSKFCNAYPEKCETPKNKTEFCTSYPYYCDKFTDWNNFKVPKRQFYGFENTAILEDIKSLGHDNETFVKIGGWYIKNEIQGPQIFFKHFKTAYGCYSIHSRVESPWDPVILYFPPLDGISIIQMTFNFEPNETFLPGREPGGLLAIHSPFELVNPYDFGISLKPGKIYKIHMKMEEEELLPFPYPSSCVNYTQMWLNNGRKGPRSQEMCKQGCVSNAIKRSCNCTFKFFNFPHDEDTCFTEDMSCVSEKAFEEIEHCIDHECKEDCQKYKFLYSTQERNIEEIDWKRSIDKAQQKTYVYVYASDPEVVVYKYRPHYQDIEVFSYIGGYIGAWLGISLVAVADFFESIIRIAAFAFRRRRQEKNRKETAPASIL